MKQSHLELIPSISYCQMCTRFRKMTLLLATLDVGFQWSAGKRWTMFEEVKVVAPYTMHHERRRCWPLDGGQAASCRSVYRVKKKGEEKDD